MSDRVCDVPIRAVVLGAVAVAAVSVMPTTIMASGSASSGVARALGPDSTSQAAISAGREIFHGAGSCFVCHGADLEGGPMAPSLAANKWKDAKGGGYSAILHVIETGVSGTAMVSHPGGISDTDAERVAAYVYAVSHGTAKP